MALTESLEAELGKPCPDFRLKSTQETWISAQDLKNSKNPFLVVFMCNHCPYVKAIEQRLEQLALDLQALDIKMVGINSNNAQKYPEDSFEKMKLKKYSFPYLYDETQEAAKSFKAVCTPDFFAFDKKGLLAYRGRLDDSWKDSSLVTKRELFEAMKLLKAGESIQWKQIPSMGCSIKWF